MCEKLYTENVKIFRSTLSTLRIASNSGFASKVHRVFRGYITAKGVTEVIGTMI